MRAPSRVSSPHVLQRRTETSRSATSRPSASGEKSNLAAFSGRNLPPQSQFPLLPLLYAPPYTVDHPSIGLNSMDPHLRVPYLNQWGTNVQYEVVRDTLIEIGYLGTKGTSLPVRRATNQALLASLTNPVNGITTNTTANTELRVPYIGFSPSGLLAEETAASLKLRRSEGAEDTILRSEIEEFRSTGRSLMPEGLEQTLGMQGIADVLAFLRQP